MPVASKAARPSLAQLSAMSGLELHHHEEAVEQLEAEAPELALKTASIMHDDGHDRLKRRGSLLVMSPTRRGRHADMAHAHELPHHHLHEHHLQQQQQQQQPPPPAAHPSPGHEEPPARPNFERRRHTVAGDESHAALGITAGRNSASVRTSLASASRIAEEEWAALFRNNLLRSCWKPGLAADEVQYILAQWERKLVEAMHRWLHPEIWAAFRVWNHRTWPRALILQVRRRKVLRYVRPSLIRWRSVSRILSLGTFLRGRILLPRLHHWRAMAGFDRRRDYASMHFAFNRLRRGLTKRHGLLLYIRALRHKSVRTALTTWLAVWVEQRSAEETAIATLTSWLHGGLRRALNTWKSLRAAAEERRLIILRWSQHSIYRLWKRWAGGYLRRVERFKASFARWTRTGYGRAFNTWKVRAAERRHGLRVLVQGVAGFVHTTMRAAYNSWSAYAALHGAASVRLRAALQALMGSALRKGWNSWRAHASSSAHLAMLVRHLSPEGRAMRKALNTWSERTVEQLHSLMLLNRAMVGLQSRLLWGFNAWASALEPSEGLIHCALGHLARRSEGAAFNTWMTYADERFQALSGLQLALGAFSASTLRRAVNSWLEYCHVVELSRRAANAMVDGGLLRGFNTWHEYAAGREHAQAVLHASLAAMRHQGTKRALLSWQEYAEARSDAVHTLSAAVHRLTNRSKLRAFNSWDGYAAERRRYRSVVAGFLMHAEKDAMRRWRAAHARAGRRFERILKRAKAALTGPHVRAMNKWRAVSENGRKLRKAVVGLRRRRERLALNAWISQCASMAAARQRAMTAIKKLGPEGRALTKGFNSWAALYTARCVMRSALLRLVNKSLSQALNTWHEIAVAMQTALKRMRRAAARFTLISIVRCINTWRGHAEEAGALRDRLSSRLRRWRNLKLNVGFNTWAEWVYELDQKRRALAHLTNRGLSQAWLTWDAYVEARFAAQQTLISSLAAMKSASLRKAFNSLVALIDGPVDPMTRALAHLANHAMAKAFTTWSDAVAEFFRATAAPRRALAHWRGIEVARALNMWEAYLHSQRMLRRAASALFNKIVKSAFNSWCEYADFRAGTTAKLEVTMRKFSPQGRALVKAFNSWRGRREEMRLLRRAASALVHSGLVRAVRKWSAVRAVGVQMRFAIRRMQSASLVRALHRWRQRPTKPTPALRSMRRLINQQLARAFTTWEVLYAERRAMRSAMSHLTHRGLSMAWRSWEAYLDSRELMALAMSALRNAATRRAVNTWTQWAEEQAEARQKIEASLSAMKSGTRAAFNTWSGRAEAYDQAMRALSHLASRNLSIGWNTWLAHLEDLERLRCAMAHLAGRGLVKAFGSWEAYVEERRTMRKAVASFVFSAARAALSTWVEFVEAREHQLNELRRVAAAFRGPQKKALNTWMEFVDQCHVQMRALTRLISQSKVRAFNAWVAIAEARAAQQERMRGALMSLSSGLRAGLNTWMEYAVQRKLAILALGSFTHQGRRRAFNTWAEWAMARGEKLDCIELALRQLFAIETRRALNRWMDLLDERERMMAAVGRMVHASLGRAMRSWDEYLEMVALKHRTLSHLINRELARGFQGWVAMVEERALMADTLTKMIHHSQRRALARWAQSAEEREEKLRVMRGTLYALAGGYRCRRALNTWADYLDERKRAIRAVSAFMHGSTRRAWNRWCSQADERAAAKATMAAALMISERRALNSWREAYEYIKFARHAVRYWRNATIAGAFRTWHRDTALTLAALRRSAGYMFYRSTARALRSWLATVEDQKALRRAVFAFTNVGLRKGINSWVSFTGHRRERMYRVRAGFMTMLHGEVRRALNSWIHAMKALMPLRRGIAYWRNAPQAKAMFKLRLHAYTMHKLYRFAFRLANQKLSKAMSAWRARFEGRRKFGRVGAAWYYRPQRLAMNSWIHHYRGKRRLRGLILAWKGTRRSFNAWKAATRQRRPLVELGAPVNLRSIKAMTWRECCAWLHSVGIHVSRSPPTLLRTLRAGAPYQELVRRISVTFWMRHKMAQIANPISLFTTLQHFFETEHVVSIVGCQRLDVGALEAGRAIEHLELLASMREILLETQEMRAVDAIARDGVMLGREL